MALQLSQQTIKMVRISFKSRESIYLLLKFSQNEHDSYKLYKNHQEAKYLGAV
ncbi:hypothetical protein MHI22_08600 [Lysinibacillus sp. FSL L8-0312]|uniref:hypothetical protein n=1 Tax=Lysinibacillus sp. FSL L8-0312 TaxID=2921521 RepID=UPI0030F6EEBB